MNQTSSSPFPSPQKNTVKSNVAKLLSTISSTALTSAVTPEVLEHNQKYAATTEHISDIMTRSAEDTPPDISAVRMDIGGLLLTEKEYKWMVSQYQSGYAITATWNNARTLYLSNGAEYIEVLPVEDLSQSQEIVFTDDFPALAGLVIEIKSDTE